MNHLPGFRAISLAVAAMASSQMLPHRSSDAVDWLFDQMPKPKPLPTPPEHVLRRNDRERWEAAEAKRLRKAAKKAGRA